MSKRFTQLTPWILAAMSLAALASITAFFGYVAAMLDAPFFALWFLAAAAIAQRALAMPASRARVASVACIGALLAAPVSWHWLMRGGWSFGAGRATLTVVVVAFFVAGEIFVATAAARALFPRRRIRFRNAAAALSLMLFVLPPAIAPVKFGMLAVFIVSVAAAATARLIAFEQRRPQRVLAIRGGALVIAAALLSISALVGELNPAKFDTELGLSFVFAASALLVAGGLIAYTAVAFAVSDVIGKLSGPFRTVRTRMIILAVVAAAAGFAVRALDFHFESLGADEQHQWIARAAFNFAISCLLVWIFAVAMARRLSRSLEQSVKAMGAIREGNLSVSLPETGDDEITEVARTFNAMVAQLREAEFLERINADLRNRSDELQRTLEALRTAQADLVRAERMASVATLARGIAHELNNPIGFIAGNVPLLRKYCDFLARAAAALADGREHSEDELHTLTQYSGRKDLRFVIEDLSRMTSDIAEGARRAQLIISDLQNLTAASQRALEEVDLHRIVRQSLALLGPRVPPSIRIETALEPVPPLHARAGQLEQVTVNLLDNAIRALPSGGTIRVRTAREGDEVVLSVNDDGIGMTDDVRRQACEPFFTTRAAGEGSGLGLAIVASIVRGHHGTLEIRSAPGQGSEITIRLPAATDAVTLAELAAPASLPV
jgi:signal transduction histidine kinase